MQNSYGAKGTLSVSGSPYGIYRLAACGPAAARLPMSLKVLLENLLRHEDGRVVRREHVEAVLHWDPAATPSQEIAFHPGRVLLQDFTGVPAVVDLAAMREAVLQLGGDPDRINPLQPADLVIDHSVQVDKFASVGLAPAERRARVPAQRRALRLPPLGRAGVQPASASCRPTRASVTRSTSSTSPPP